MSAIRKAGWFLSLALAMACVMGVLGSVRGTAIAGMIPSRASDGSAERAAKIEKIRAVLESKVVAQKLVDYGVSPEEAMAKVRGMSDGELHQLASLTDRAAEGSDSALGFLIGVAILVILVIVILKLLNKEVVVR